MILWLHTYLLQEKSPSWNKSNQRCSNVKLEECSRSWSWIKESPSVRSKNWWFREIVTNRKVQKICFKSHQLYFHSLGRVKYLLLLTTSLTTASWSTPPLKMILMQSYQAIHQTWDCHQDLRAQDPKTNLLCQDLQTSSLPHPPVDTSVLGQPCPSHRGRHRSHWLPGWEEKLINWKQSSTRLTKIGHLRDKVWWLRYRESSLLDQDCQDTMWRILSRKNYVWLL